MFSMVDSHSHLHLKHKSLHCYSGILGANSQAVPQNGDHRWRKNSQPAEEEKAGKAQKINSFTMTKGQDALKFSAEEVMNWKGEHLWGFKFWEHLCPLILLTGLTIFPFVSHVKYTSCLWVWVRLLTFWNFFGFYVVAVLTIRFQKKLLEDTTCHYSNREIVVFSQTGESNSVNCCYTLLCKF